MTLYFGNLLLSTHTTSFQNQPQKSEQDPLLVYLSNVWPKSKRSGRRTNNIGLVMGKNKNVTFELRNKFPGARIINLYHQDHYGQFYRAAIQYNRHYYIWDDYKNYWTASKIEIKHLENVLNGAKALVLLMNTDSSKTWQERVCIAVENCSDLSVKQILAHQWFIVNNEENYNKLLKFCMV